jgi:hypothetical protein
LTHIEAVQPSQLPVHPPLRIGLASERYTARASLQPMYDPKSERPKS